MFDLKLIKEHNTPLYYYDMSLLRATVETALAALPSDRFKIHYAIKANNNPEILRLIASYDLGADCVSVGELKQAIEAGFSCDRLVYAGVGKRDDEIRFAIEHDIELSTPPIVGLRKSEQKSLNLQHEERQAQ